MIAINGCALVIRFITVDFDPVDFAIRENTGGYCSHVEMLTADNKWLGAHAVTGVQLRAYDYCSPSWERRYRLPVNPTQYSNATAYGLAQVGTPYGYRTIWADLFRLHWDINKVGRGMDCSWFIYNVLLKARISALNVLPEFADLVTPESLHLSPIFIGHLIEPKVG